MMTQNQTSGERPASDEPKDLHRDAEPKGASGSTGEDEGSAAKEGNEDHLKPDQKTTSR